MLNNIKDIHKKFKKLYEEEYSKLNKKNNSFEYSLISLKGVLEDVEKYHQKKDISNDIEVLENKINVSKEKLETLYKLKKLKYIIFAFIIKNYNKKIMSEIIEEGYSLNLSITHLGRIEAVKKERVDRKAIDWKKSNDYKKELISNNITPKSKDNPDGQEWLIYFNNDTYACLKWRLSNKKYIESYQLKEQYVFKPVRENSKKVNRLNRENPKYLER